ncbi:MAG: hypothetical protein KBD37_01030 [Burkholderiales bacterium]|nr:hypothetical protein [Burkholderiales bacterium]
MNNVSYMVSIFDILTNQNNIISNDTNDINGLLSNYGIERILIINNLFMPLANSAVIDLTYSAVGAKVKLFNSAIAEGNLVKIEELFNNSYKTVFVGYIATVNIGQDTQIGLNITLNCLSLLGQLSYQLVANDINDTLMLGGGEFPITDFVANQVELGKILVAFQNQSLMSYALNHQITTSYDTYAGEQLAFLIPSGADNLTPNTPVYFFASTNDNRFDSLLRTVYAYQRLIYQDLDGTIKIAIPSVAESGAAAISDFYSFDIGKFNDTVDNNSIKYDRYNISKNAGIVCNRAFASLVPVGFNLIGKNEQNTINYVANLSDKLFSRGQQLLKSGIFTISKHDIVDLSDNMVKDPTLLRLFGISQGSNSNIIATNLSGSSTSTRTGMPIVGLYANRLLSQDAFLETQLEIDLPRLSCYNAASDELANIPLGYMVNVDDNGNLGLETNKFYCYQMLLNYDINNGTKLSLGLCKPYSFTTLWSN